MNNITTRHAPTPSVKPSNKYSNIPKPYLNIAEKMESQFINHMLNQISKGSMTKKDNNATQFYKSLLTKERSDIMSKVKNGIGLKDIILDQILPNRYKVSQSSAHKAYQLNQAQPKEVRHE